MHPKDHFQIGVVCRMKDTQVVRKLLPLTQLEQVRKVVVFRDRPIELPESVSVCPPRMVRSIPFLRDVWRLGQLIAWLMRGRLDLLMGIYLLPHGMIAGMAGRMFHKPVIQNIVGKDLTYALQFPYLFRFVRQADSVICRGPMTKKLIADQDVRADKIFLPPNLFEFDKLPAISSNVSKAYDIICVGSLIPKKQHGTLLRAVHELKMRMGHSAIRAGILGEGRMRKTLEDLREQLGLKNNVDFPGFKSNVYEYLARSKVFVLLSEDEGLPMAMIEAMAYGLPCVVTDHADIPSVAKSEYNAFLIPGGDISAAVDAIHRLLTDHVLYNRMSANAAKIRDEKTYEYSMRNICDIWSEMLDRLGQ